eukprot:1350782-Karenia_brevis.AAC.1
MLEDIGYDDMGVVQLLTCGVEVVGMLDRIGIWKPTDPPVLVSKSLLWQSAREAQAKLTAPRRPGDLDSAVWEITLEDVKDGNLEGPFSPEQVEKLLGPRWIGARRFGIQQGEKIRAVDDFSEFH